MFLPIDISSFIQPVDQRVIAGLKAYYLRKTFAQDATEEDTEKSMMHCWKDYHIYDCIQNLTLSWGDVTGECMNRMWKKTLKRFVHDFKGFAKDEIISKVNKTVVEKANKLNMGVNEDNIEPPKGGSRWID